MNFSSNCCDNSFASIQCSIKIKHIFIQNLILGTFCFVKFETCSKQATLDERHCALNELRGWSLLDDCSSNNVKCVKMLDILRNLVVETIRHGSDCASESLFELDMKDLEAIPTSWLGSSLRVKRMSL